MGVSVRCLVTSSNRVTSLSSLSFEEEALKPLQSPALSREANNYQ